jgi:hypothetical protein
MTLRATNLASLGTLFFVSVFVSVFVLAGCGGTKNEAIPQPSAPEGATAGAPAPAASSEPKEAAGSTTGTIPTECAKKDGDLCLPDPGFIKRLCDGSFPDVALRLFAGGSPWTRAYLTRDVDGWNAEGGAAARARLAFDEEMLILRRRSPPKGGIQVGSGGGYLVLRVDGSCYTVDEIEVTQKKPPKPKSGPVTFRYLDEATQTALLKNARIESAYSKRRKECKGVTSGEVTKACEAADTELARAVPEEVRKGIELPKPARIP